MAFGRYLEPHIGCDVEGCDRPHQSLGYCKGHANRVRRYGHPGTAEFRIRKIENPEIEPDPTKQCSGTGCRRRILAKGLCPTHYRRWSRHGDPNTPLRQKSLPKQCSVDGCTGKPTARDMCNPHYLKTYHKQNPPIPGSHRKYTRKHILAQYGMTIADYDKMLADQGECCAICRSPYPGHNGSPNYSWCVDHCHDSAQVRGLLCRDCNVALGLMKDDPIVIRAALDYLTRIR